MISTDLVGTGLFNEEVRHRSALGTALFHSHIQLILDLSDFERQNGLNIPLGFPIFFWGDPDDRILGPGEGKSRYRELQKRLYRAFIVYSNQEHNNLKNNQKQVSFVRVVSQSFAQLISFVIAIFCAKNF